MRGVLVYPDIRLLDWDDPGQHEEECCPASLPNGFPGYGCTLPPGHLGCHQAWGWPDLAAVWDQDDGG